MSKLYGKMPYLSTTEREKGQTRGKVSIDREPQFILDEEHRGQEFASDLSSCPPFPCLTIAGVGSTARADIFETDEDYLAFLRVLRDTLEKKPMRIPIYCLMAKFGLGKPVSENHDDDIMGGCPCSMPRTRL